MGLTLLPALLVAAATTAAPRILVVDLEVRDADVALRAPTTALVVRKLEATGRYDVVAGEDVRRALELAASQQAAGCDATSCLDEIAGALGARFVLFGDLTQLDGETHLTLSLFDHEVLRSVARATAALPRSPAAEDVVGRLVRHLARELDAYTGAFPMAAVVGITGAAGLLGGAALAALGAWQLALLGEDEQRHDRLLEDFEASRDRALAKEAAELQQQVDERLFFGAVLLAAGLPLAAGGLAAAGWGLWESFE
jgi:hypothetical protein